MGTSLLLIMGLFPIPQRLEDWSVDVLNHLVSLKDVEADKFDFKAANFSELFKDICAMSNTSGGTIVLGVDEIRNPKTNYLLRFRKKGFKDGEQTKTESGLNNALHNIEPFPTIEYKHLTETDKSFYVIVKVNPDSNNRPYFVKGSGSCYVRVNASSVPATRAVFFNLFSNMSQRRNDIQRLRNSTYLLKEAFQFTCKKIKEISPNDHLDTINPVNLDFFKNSILYTDWFFRENEWHGGNTSPTSHVSGLHSLIYDLESLNLNINTYNKDASSANRKTIKQRLEFWYPGANLFDQTLSWLDAIIGKCDDFLSKSEIL